MAVEPVTVAAGVANITAALPVVQDALVYGANWMVQNTVGVLVIAASLVSFGVGKIVGMFRSRRGRR